MHEIMKKRIEQFNQFVMSQDIEKLPIGLFCGKMGLCIYFYHQEQIKKNKRYGKFADKLLNSIFKQINIKTLISLEDGLIGVGLGLNYLIDNGFQRGNVNHILPELDDKVYKTAWFDLLNGVSGSTETLKSIFEVALYFTIRLQNNKLNGSSRFLYEAIVIKAINYIETNAYYSDRYVEPLFYSLNEYFISNYLFLLGKVYRLGFYNYKIDKIVDEIYTKIYGLYPLLQSNRLQLATTLGYLNDELLRPSIDECLARLRREINYEQFIQSEFRNQNLLLVNGLCGMYLIQNVLFENEELPKELVVDKLVRSKLWDDVSDNKVKQNATTGLFTGLAGVILIYQHIIKNN